MADIRIKTETSCEVRRSLNRLANLVVNGKLDPKKANCAGYLLNIALSALRTDELESKVIQLEKTIEEMQKIQEKLLK